MASAVLASRNETHWGERKVYMRKTPNSANLNPKSNPNPKKSIVDLSDNFHGRHADELVAPSEDSSSFNRKPIGVSHRKDYVTFNVASYSRRELKELKRRLLSELEQVRSLASRINSREFQPRSVYSSSQSYGGINWPPPPLKIPAIDSPLGGRSDGSREKRTPKTNSYYRGSEFVTGKEKFSPVEQKKASGFKRAPSPLTPGRDLKKTAGSSDAGMKSCRHILTKMWKHKDCWIFLAPVDAEKLGLHDYHQIIKYPMDLGTVKRKLEKKLYSSPLDFASDVRLTFNNALKYNPKGHDVNTWAEKLLGWFDELFAPVARKALSVEEEVHPSSWSQAPPPESIRKPQAPPVAAPVHTPVVQNQSQDPVQTSRASAGGRAFPRKQPKPKAKDPNKREMSFEEKQKLSMDLQNLPQEKMDQVVQIIRKRNSNLSQHGDEIELDIEAVDKETLWELDRFVSNCKKMMSKIKRQAQTIHHKAETSISREENKSSIGEIPRGYAKTTKKVVETGDEDVDIGEEMPSTNFPPVVIERDKDTGYASRSSSSSSSSSGSSSSSSDSDSGSSSSSDSDGGDEAQSPFDKSKASPRS